MQQKPESLGTGIYNPAPRLSLFLSSLSPIRARDEAAGEHFISQQPLRGYLDRDDSKSFLFLIIPPAGLPTHRTTNFQHAYILLNSPFRQ